MHQYTVGKISLRQAMFLFVIIVFSPAVRLFPSFTAEMVGPAAWLTPFFAFVVMLPLLYILHLLFKNAPEATFPQLMDRVCGKVVGRIITMGYFVWIFLLEAAYLRYYSERIMTTILPNVDSLVFLVPLILLVIMTLRKSTVVLARMGEIILPVILLIFIACFLAAVPAIKIKRLTPVSYTDVFPLVKASMGMVSIWSYLFFIVFFSGVIKGREKIKRCAVHTIGWVAAIGVLIIVMSIGLLGSGTVSMIPIPYFAAVRQISLFQSIERIESAVVSLWVLSDYVLIAVFSALGLEMLKHVFSLQSTKGLIGLYGVLLLCGALYIAGSQFELATFSMYVAIPGNWLFAYGIPLLVLVIGKVRKAV